MTTTVSSVTSHFPSAEDGFTTTLSSTISAGATTVGLNSVAGYANNEVAVMVVAPSVASEKQVFTGIVDTSGIQLTGVKWTTGTNQTHAAGTTVVDYATATHISMMSKGLLVEHDQDGTHKGITTDTIVATTGTFTNLTVSGTATSQGWTALGATPTGGVTANGNRNYDLVFNSVDLSSTLSPGMKLQLTRTVAAPSKSTLLNGTTQYYNKTSPAGVGATDNITAQAWIKLTSYNGAINIIIGNSNSTTNGWNFYINQNGAAVLNGARVGDDNVTAYASVPLNKWTHVAASINSAGTAGAVYYDGVAVTSAFTNNANTGFAANTGSYSVGASSTGSLPFAGAIAQAACFSTVLSATTIKNSMDRTLSGSETSIMTAHSFNNTLNDLTANANNLTAQGSAVATNADSPFANAVTAGSLEYAEINSVTFSTNTTVNVRVPDTCQIPTTGGVSAVSYSTQSNPYGLPYFSKVIGYALLQSDSTTTATSVTAALGFSITAYIPTNAKIRISFYSGGVYNSTTNQCRVSVWDGTVGSGTALIGGLNGNDSGQVIAFSMSNTLTPASGSKTYNVGFYGSGAGTTYISSSSTVPAYLQVELV